MKNLFKFALGGVVMLVASMATAADDVTIQLKWVTQTQFAGYYVAQDKGFYKDESSRLLKEFFIERRNNTSVFKS